MSNYVTAFLALGSNMGAISGSDSLEIGALLCRNRRFCLFGRPVSDDVGFRAAPPTSSAVNEAHLVLLSVTPQPTQSLHCHCVRVFAPLSKATRFVRWFRYHTQPAYVTDQPLFFNAVRVFLRSVFFLSFVCLFVWAESNQNTRHAVLRLLCQRMNSWANSKKSNGATFPPGSAAPCRAAARGVVRMSARDRLILVQLECRSFGRSSNRLRNGPRPLDIDILCIRDPISLSDPNQSINSGHLLLVCD
jgi:7,8-dihydro-6-hydroxymethylpterin-pyrophosphokinase